MVNKKAMRKRLFVDRKVQGALILRVLLYWGACLITVTLMLLCWQIMTGPPRPFQAHLTDLWFHYGPALVVSLLLLPPAVVDLVRMSNRVVGPVLRLRRCMRELARGEHVEPIEFRDGDFWQEFAREFNAVAARLEQGGAAAESCEEDRLVCSTTE